jgi:hypothetical protein
MDTTFVRNPNAEAFLSLGCKHRPLSMANFRLSMNLQHQISTELKVAVGTFADHVEDVTQAPGLLFAWSQELSRLIDQHVASLQNLQSFADFAKHVLKANEFVLHALPGNFDRFLSAVRSLQQHYVFSYVDKASNNVCIVCKKSYIQAMWSDLGSNAVFSNVTHQWPGGAAALASDMQSTLSADGRFDCMVHDKQTLPYYAGIGKFHKQPLKFRYLSCSSNMVLTTPSIYITRFLAGVKPDVFSLWDTLHRQLQGILPPGQMHMPWMIFSSDQLLPVLQAFRNRGMAWDEVVRRGMHSTYDFERLYTNIPQSDLKARIGQLVDQIFALRPHMSAVKVYRQKGLGLKWLQQTPIDTAVWCASDRGQRYQIFNLASIKFLLNYLIDHTYVEFTGHLYHQILGIPMGISPAVYVSNYYLLTYELSFFEQLLPYRLMGTRSPRDVSALRALALNSHQPFDLTRAGTHGPDLVAVVLDSFLYTARYIDDLYTLGNPLWPHLMYTSQVWQGLHGIYPPALNLALTARGHTVPYMDVSVGLQAIPASPYMMADYYTELFDKRTVGPFQHMSIIRYPHITTALSSSAKYNVLSTEFHRLIRRISVTPNLLYSLGQLCYNLSKLGYDIAFLMSKLHQLFHRIGPRYLPGDPSIYISQVSHYLYAHYTRNGLIYYAQALLAAPLVARHFLLRRRGRR